MEYPTEFIPVHDQTPEQAKDLVDKLFAENAALKARLARVKEWAIEEYGPEPECNCHIVENPDCGEMMREGEEIHSLLTSTAPPLAVVEGYVPAGFEDRKFTIGIGWLRVNENPHEDEFPVTVIVLPKEASHEAL